MPNKLCKARLNIFFYKFTALDRTILIPSKYSRHQGYNTVLKVFTKACTVIPRLSQPGSYECRVFQVLTGVKDLWSRFFLSLQTT